MNKFVKVVSLLMALIMCLGMIACSNGAAPASETKNEAAPAAETKDDSKKEGSGTGRDVGLAQPEAAKDLDGTFEVGVVCALSSTHAATNGWLMASLEATQAYVNGNGGIDGKKLIYTLYDPESDASTLKQRLTDIKNSGAVLAIAGVNDALAPAAAQWASENEYPVFLTSNTSTEITLGNYSDYAFSMGKNAWGFGKILALHCVGKEGKKNFCFVGTDGAATIDAENFLLYEGKKIDPNFEMLGSFRINFNDTEFSNIIAAATALNPEMVLQQGGGPNFVSFCQQASLFGLFDFCDVYNDLVTDASTNQPLIEGDEFPYGKTHGITTLPFWDIKNMDEDLQYYYDLWSKTEIATTNGYLVSEHALNYYNIMKCMLLAVDDCVKNGKDYNDPKVLTEAISNVKWSDYNGNHYFRTGIDNQFVSNLYYGTSAYSDEYPGVAICGPDWETYSGEEFLPSAEEMKAWAADHNWDTTRFN